MTTDLIKRLEEATEGSRELDWAVAEYLGKIPKHSVREVGFDYDWYRSPGEWALWKANDSEGRNHSLWQPDQVTTSLDAAMTLVPEGAFVTLSISPRGTTCDAEVNLNNGRFLLNADTVETGMAITGPLALCISALKAKDQS